MRYNTRMSSTTTTSHWQATAPAFALDLNTHELPPTADAVVVGGGILGASAAYWLARSGIRVALLDQTSLAAGATGRNGGFLTVGAATTYTHAIQTWGHAAAKAIWQLTYDNRDLLRAVLAEESIDCDYREPGTIHLALREDELDALLVDVSALNADGFAHETLDRADVQVCTGAVLGEGIIGGLFLPGGGLLHSGKLVAGIGHAAQRHGARLCRGRVLRVEALGQSTRVHTDAGAINTNGVVIAANAWLRELVPALRDVVIPVRGQVVNFAPVAPVFRAGMGASVTDTAEYWQQTPDGTIVLGGCRAIHPTRDEDTLEDAITDDVQSALETVLPALFPSLAGKLRVARRWSGPMAFTKDRLPVLDRMPTLPNAWFAGGFCGHGMPFGMVFGKMLAEAVMLGKTLTSTSTSVDMFAMSRFATG
jgi:glycine/D-amino acid oxidase-like deaminating enzyme